jgi:hypothetical protein
MTTPLRPAPLGPGEGGSSDARFGAGLTEPQVRRFQTILHEECGVDLSLPAAWSRAIELLSLFEVILQERGVLEQPNEESPEFALPRS